MSAAGEIFEVLTLTYTDFKGKNGHRRRDTILTPRSNLKFRFAYAPKAPTPQDCVSSFRLKNHYISSLVRKKLPKSPLGQPKLIKIFASTHSGGKMRARATESCYRVMSLLIEMRIPDPYRYVDVI